MVAEARMYQLLQNMARKELKNSANDNGGSRLSSPGLTYISVGHRPSLLAFHDKRLGLTGSSNSNNGSGSGDGGYEWSDIENKPTASVVPSAVAASLQL